MKKLSFLLCALFMIVLASCGSKGYNPETCKELATKIDNHEQLTEKDYSTMIDQMVSAAKIVKEKTDKIGNDPEKMKEFENDPANKELAEYAMGFALYIGLHQQDLSPANVKKLMEAQKEMEKLKTK